MKNTMDIDHILSVLPHGHPFIFVDRVLDYHFTDYVHAVKNISYNEPYFPGHFPIKPVMPGALIIECMAQAVGALCLAAAAKSQKENNLFLLAGVDKTRFKQMVVPGDQLHLVCRLVKARRNLVKFACEGLVDEQLCCSAELILVQEEAK